MIDFLLSCSRLATFTQCFTGVWVAIVFRESARRYLKSDLMAFLELLTGIPEVNIVRVDVARLEQCWLGHAVAKTRSNHAIG
jgi:hypothetical protein